MKENVVNPDLGFVKDISKVGGGTVKKCYQCATCSIVCDSAPDDRPFPRQQMLMAQWGLKDKLMSDPAIWLCHQCETCSIHCPREAKPMEVFAKLRQLAIEHYSPMGFMYKILAEKKYLPIALGFPVAVLFLVLAVTGRLSIEGGTVLYTKMFEHLTIDIMFTSFFFLGAFAAFIGGMRFWKNMAKNHPKEDDKPAVPIIKALIALIKDIAIHKKFDSCTGNVKRKLGHLLIMYGFIGLFLTTASAVISIYVFDYYPIPPTNFIKILGNGSAVAFLIGLTIVTMYRLSDQKNLDTKGNFFDWILLVDFWLVVITGLLCEFLRLQNIASLAYPMYFIHLVFVFYVLAYFPFTKFAHLGYRFIAMLYIAHTNRKY